MEAEAALKTYTVSENQILSYKSFDETLFTQAVGVIDTMCIRHVSFINFTTAPL